MQHDHRASDTNERYRKVSRYVFLGFVAVATYFLIAEHRAHIVLFSVALVSRLPSDALIPPWRAQAWG